MILLGKESIPSKKTILVTDSGLGGLSVFARIAACLAKKSPWKNISMVYFNSWPEKNRGYNHFETMNKRARVFNNALNAMEQFAPDMILIACNTLSVIYPFTRHSKISQTPVSGIIEHGVKLIYDHLCKDLKSQVILFGTPTTIAENSHRKALLKMGISPDRITCQGCTNLAGKIERTPFSTEVTQMINANIETAVSKMDNPDGDVYAALCCTHFGYCRDLFHEALSRHINGKIFILNPNQRMADQAVETVAAENKGKKNIIYPDIDMQVVSRIFWEPERINAYVTLLKNVSPETIKALADYKWNPDLFEV